MSNEGFEKGYPAISLINGWMSQSQWGTTNREAAKPCASCFSAPWDPGVWDPWILEFKVINELV
jgi:hypothetical protein